MSGELVIAIVSALAAVGLAILTWYSYRHSQRQAAITQAEHEWKAEARSLAAPQVRLVRGSGRTTFLELRNAGSAQARDVALEFDKDAKPTHIDMPLIPLLEPEQAVRVLVLLSGQDPDVYRGKIRWSDEYAQHEKPFVLTPPV